MAGVWLCRAPDNQRVAVKWLDRVTPRARTRFLREYSALARVNHPGVVAALGQGVAEGRPFMVMEYIQGVDLRVYANKLRLRPPAERAAEVRRMGEALCLALEAVHAAGLIHRDVKPSNVMQDERGRVRLTDFGVVKDADSVERTRAGILVGTAAYASPEQIRGEALDPRSDLYSLGCTLYFLAAGQRPYPSSERTEVVSAHLRAAVPRVRQVDPRFPPELDAIISRLMAKSPDDRYPDARAARRALAAAGDSSSAPTLAGRRRYVDQVRASLALVKQGEGRVLRVRGARGSGRRWLLEIADDLTRRGGIPVLIAEDEAALAEGAARLAAGEALALVTLLTTPLPDTLKDIPEDTVRLEPLGMADVRRTVVSIAPSTPSPSLIAERLHRASGGHPAWLVPLLECCRAGDILRLPDPLPVPAAVLEAIGALEFEVVEVLVALVALNQPSDRPLIEAAAQLPAEDALATLEAAGLVISHQGRWWPTGEVVRRAALDVAADPDASRLRASRALEGNEHGEAVDAGPDIRRVSLGGGLADAMSRARDAATLARADGDRAREARAALTRGAVALDAGDLTAADQALSDAVALARAVTLPSLRRAAHVLRAQTTLESRPGSPGAAASALDRLNRALTRVPGEDPEGYRVLAATVQARAFATLGDRRSWLDATARADAQLSDVTDPLIRLQADLELARAALLAGDRDNARARAQRCMAASDEASLPLVSWLAARIVAAADGAATPAPDAWLPEIGPEAARRLSARPIW